MRRTDRVALLLSLAAVVLSAWVAWAVYENVPHLEDEIAYVWQARLTTESRIALPSPPYPKNFLVPFIVDYNGLRFSKYPLGWPVMLGAGVALGLRAWVNPLLAGLAVWLVYLVGKRVFGEAVALTGCALLVVSPFFLLNTGSLLSHPFGLVLTAAFTLFWLDLFAPSQTAPPAKVNNWLKVLTLGLVMGVLVLSRPFTALAIAFPFGLHALYLLFRGGKETRLYLIGFGLIALLVSVLHFAWQYAVTGDALLNPYTLWWEYDRVGFGPGVGRSTNGHTLRQGWFNTRHSLRAGYSDLFGWGNLSWLMLPFGLWALRRNLHGWLVAAIFPMLVVYYLAYWVGSWLFGPRYYYEGLLSLVLVSGAGIALLAGWPLNPGERAERRNGWQRWRAPLVSGIVALLVAGNLIFYLPPRLGMMKDLYGIGRENLEPFQSESAEALTPALVIVHAQRWMPYGALLELEDPGLTTPFIFTLGAGAQTESALAGLYPHREIYHYYPEMPWNFFPKALDR